MLIISNLYYKFKFKSYQSIIILTILITINIALITMHNTMYYVYEFYNTKCFQL